MTENTRHETPDVAELRRLAEVCPMPDDDPDITQRWYADASDLRYVSDRPADVAFIIAASPDVVLALLDRVREAEAMREARDAAHTHTCEPAWRPTTADEIQPGWEVRSRCSDGREGRWGVAHSRGPDGDWHTERDRPLTWDANGWTYETTAPLPEPEPWDDDTLDEWEDALRSTIDLDAGWTTSTRAVLNLLAERGLLDRAAIAGGGQS